MIDNVMIRMIGTATGGAIGKTTILQLTEAIPLVAITKTTKKKLKAHVYIQTRNMIVAWLRTTMLPCIPLVE